MDPVRGECSSPATPRRTRTLNLARYDLVERGTILTHGYESDRLIVIAKRL
jgi:hypothetical protein